jgi:hypothetical protein
MASIDKLDEEIEVILAAIAVQQQQANFEAIRLHNEWREQMRTLQAEVDDIRQKLNNHIRDSDSNNG